MLVRTRIGPALSGALLAAILSVIVAGDGGPPRHGVNLPPVDTPPRVNSPDDSVPPPAPSFQYIGRQPTLDTYALAGLRSGGVYLAAFLLLHLLSRRLGSARRWSYATIGALALTAAVISLTHWQAWPVLVARGVVSWYLVSACLMGAIIGFGYYRAAGLEPEGDTPDALKAMLNQPAASPGEGASSAAPAYIQTDGAEYFSGPLQVRTVLPLAFVAALLSAGTYAMIRMALGGLPELAVRLDQGVPLAEAIGLALSSQAGTLVVMGLAAPVPFAVVVLLSHLILKAWGKSSYLAYIGIGAASPVILSLLAGPIGLLLGIQALVPMALAMVVYRHMAGVEPAPVKEDIILNDRRNLVAADHPRRQFGRLVKN